MRSALASRRLLLRVPRSSAACRRLSCREPLASRQLSTLAATSSAGEAEDEPRRTPRLRGEHIALVHLPEALDAALRECSLPELKRVAESLRRAGPSAAAAEPPTVHEFAAARLDLAYAASYRMLHEANARIPGFAPASALDVGAGLSPFAWAAHGFWGAQAPRTVAVEPRAPLRSVGAQLSAHARLSVQWRARLPTAPREPSDEREPWLEADDAASDPRDGYADAPLLLHPAARGSGDFDLVNASHALCSLDEAGVETACSALWSHVSPEGGVLALVEPATPAGFATILRARDALLSHGAVDEAARIVAPCAHARPCPIAPGQMVLPWTAADKRAKASTCHLVQKVVESTHRQYWERERRRGKERRQVSEAFCYLLAQRGTPPAVAGSGGADGEAAGPPWARVLRPPRKRRRHVLVDICHPSGEAVTSTLTKRTTERASYRLARKLRLGDTMPLAALEIVRRKQAGGVAGDDDDDEVVDEYYYEEDDSVDELGLPEWVHTDTHGTRRGPTGRARDST